MIWKDVTYLCDGVQAKLRWTTPEEPEVIKEEIGIIRVAGWGCVPTFHSGNGRHVRSPGPNTLVILQ